MTLTALGVALGVCLLLFAAVALPALHAHDVRNGWIGTSSHNRQPALDESLTDPMLWRVSADRFDGREIVRVDVAAMGPHSPVPEWLTRLPRPGEIAASASMAKLLRETDPAMLGDRYPGRVTLTVGPDALASSAQLVVVVGRTDAELRSEGGRVTTVRSIESAPVTHDFSRFLRIVLLVGALGLLVPVVVFVSTATRLAAARREQRLAAMRLAGATPRQAGAVAAMEAALGAAAGTALGFVAFVVLRPYVARIPFDGYAFYREDLHLSPAPAVLISLGVPALAASAALLSLRRVRISPLGVTRQVTRPRPTAWRLGALVAAVAVFFVALVKAKGQKTGVSTASQAAVGVAFALIVLAIVLCGPWLTSLVARVMSAVGRRAPTLLAARRLDDNPSAGFRAISGLILAVFVVTLVSALAASVTASTEERASPIAPGTVGIAVNSPVRVSSFSPENTAAVIASGLEPEAAAWLLDELRQTSGVRHVVDVRAVPSGQGEVEGPVSEHGDTDSGTYVLARADTGVVSCEGAALLGATSCNGTTGIEISATVSDHFGTAPLGQVIPPEALDDLPLVGVAVFTNGSAVAIERARTLLERSFPGAQALTGRDIYAEWNSQVRDTARLSNIALVVTLLIAGCSLAVSVAGGLVERKRPFALLRLAGMPLGQLHRVILAEAAAPLVAVACVSVALGFAVDVLLIHAIGGATTFHLPAIGYWASLGAGMAFALGIVGGTLPLLDRLTSLESARFE
jgi:predicted lysophospholipase L1 biosynthesis ABC-type transport system permease subunit